MAQFNAQEWDDNAKQAEQQLRDAISQMTKAQREGAVAVLQFHNDWFSGETPCGHKRLGRIYTALAREVQPA
jgi:hypothetical protein